MTDWTSGYVAEIDYTYGYYPELSPPLLALATLNKRVSTRDGPPRRYLELGFGQGLSLAIHAAACTGEFWGTDFNPAQAANARSLVAAAGITANIFDQSFGEFAAREDLPEFDVIGLHGIWSWISDENRAILIDIVRRKLAIGGLLYVSYNCTPGWAAAMPLRHLMTIQSELAGSDEKGIVGRIEGALAFVQKVADSGSEYFRANPAVVEQFKALKNENRNYLAHEYFNRDWHPMPFSRVAEMFSAAKVDFAASADLIDHVDALNLSPQGQQLLTEIDHPILRESVRDYLANTRFRKDIFVKGGRALNPIRQIGQLCAQGFVLTTPSSEITLTIHRALGEVALDEALYKPLIDLLADDDYAPKSLDAICASPSMQAKRFVQVAEALMILTGMGHVSPTQDGETVERVGANCNALNTHIFHLALYDNKIRVLASPLTGTGVAVNRFEQLFLLARQNGNLAPDSWADFAWSVLRANGQTVLKEGSLLHGEEANVAELRVQATSFFQRRLPIFRALKIA